MSEFFQRPILRNPTRPLVGPDAAFIDNKTLGRRVGDNMGNMVFMHAIRGQIRNIKHVSEGGGGKADVNVLGSANQINKNMNKRADDPLFKKSNAPFVSIGLGAQAPNFDVEFKMPEGTKAWLEVLRSRAPGKAPNISVRGEFTYSVMKNAGLGDAATPLGCPSLYINPWVNLGSRIAKKANNPVSKVNVAPGNITKNVKKFDAIERSLLDIVTKTQGSYIIQHPMSVVAMSRGDFDDVEEDTIKAVRDAIMPDASIEDFINWYRAYATIHVDIPSWLENHRSADLVVSTRIHGTMTAIAAATPGVCVAIDARQRELCEIMHIPHIMASEVQDGITIDIARDVIASHDWKAFDHNRVGLAKKYRAFLNRNLLEASTHLDRLADASI